MALPTRGRVVLETTFGEVDIELWAKETPRACRNFIALALEGYYDGVIFHRIVPGFLAQTGDRTGTGNGGESFYGEPFEDEIHPRLRYTHRGLVGMANNGTKHSNDSQFFLTLDRTDELHGKHTLFGRVIGDTIYNVMKLSEMEIDKNNRPVYPPKIKSIRVLDNPFDDIIPRITAAERRTQLRAKEQAQREREEEQRRRGAKKNTKLLSFEGDEGGEQEEPETFKKKSIFRPDLVDDTHPSTVIPESTSKPLHAAKQEKREADDSKTIEALTKPSKKLDKADDDLSKIRERHAKEQTSASDARRAQIEQMEADIRKMAQRHEDSGDESSKKKPRRSYLQEGLAKYSKGRGLHGKKGKDSKRKDESDVLAVLDVFRDKLRSTMLVDEEEDDKHGDSTENAEGIEVDDDFGFMTHSLQFPKGNEVEEEKAARDYEVIDPRARGAQAREEERERKRLKMTKESKHGGGHGGGGRSRGQRDIYRDTPRH